MDHISGFCRVYLSKKGHDELFEDLNVQIYQKKKKITLFPTLPFLTVACSPCFLFMAVYLA